ncbi:uncharacterized protein LOC135924825 [Gordionus sp. m RMFG-2023]|uniref:uncharacterized protein LOC135924825 n=1 Tax=Gordionus sp. m RMFG-2023 TaxID=3053472 RepID=UPI0031FBC8B0
METSDYLQGFNFLLDSSSSHLSLQIHMLHYLKDEYPNKSIFVYMSFPDYLYDDQLDLDLKNGVKQTFYRELINSASLLNHLYNDNDSIECLFPLSLIENPFDLNKSNHKSWLPTALIDFSKAKSLYERSALISTAFASTTLPYRNFANAYYRMHHLSNFLSNQNSFRRIKMQKISCKYFFSDHDTQDNVFTLTPYSNYDVNKINESPINAFNVTRGFQSAVRKLEDIRQPTIKKEDAFEKIVNWENLNMVNGLQLSPAFPWIFNQPSLKSDDPFRSLNTYHSMESDPQLQINFFNQLLKQIECHYRSSSGAFTGLEEKDEKNEIIEFLNDYAA